MLREYEQESRLHYQNESILRLQIESLEENLEEQRKTNKSLTNDCDRFKI